MTRLTSKPSEVSEQSSVRWGKRRTRVRLGRLGYRRGRYRGVMRENWALRTNREKNWNRVLLIGSRQVRRVRQSRVAESLHERPIYRLFSFRPVPVSLTPQYTDCVQVFMNGDGYWIVPRVTRHLNESLEHDKCPICTCQGRTLGFEVEIKDRTEY